MGDDRHEWYGGYPPPICPDVDEYTCAECKGHNRCEIEEAAGFGDYGRDDPREDR